MPDTTPDSAGGGRFDISPPTTPEHIGADPTGPEHPYIPAPGHTRRPADDPATPDESTPAPNRPLLPQATDQPRASRSDEPDGAGSGTPQDQPEPANPEIGLYGFRGTGDPKYVEDDEPLIYAGHVGISFDGGKTIYGFTPNVTDPETGEPLSSEQAIESLKQHTPYPGVVQDDTALFKRAQRLFERGERTQVFVWNQQFTPEEFNRILNEVRQEEARSPMQDKRYNFPDPKYPDCNNCATWPGTLGVDLPEPSGNLKYYIPELADRGQPWARQPDDH